jgi:predicted ferric reductase
LETKMKSPVYGSGRNRKRNKGPFHASAANINMHGKKSKSYDCWCCVCIDMRDSMIKKIHKKEMRNI